MYVVRRPFRNFGVMLEPGSVIEPASIKRFKTRLKDRYIVEVNQDNFKYWQAYFKGRMSVNLTEQVESVESVESVEVKKVVKAVATAKAKAKA